MLYGGLVLSDYFRNYVPVAPDLEIEVEPSVPFTIDIKEFLMQGARDQELHTSPDPEVLARIPVQRGWRLRAIITEPPRHGTVEWNPNTGSFTYTANVAYEGPDCFNYVLTNGYQKSLQAMVSVTIGRSYEVNIIDIVRTDFPQDPENPEIEPDPSYYEIAAEFYQPPAADVPLFIEYIWYYADYKFVDNTSGVNRVYSRKEIIYRTAYTSTYRSGYYPDVTDRADTLENFYPEINEGIIGLVQNSAVPYRDPVQTYEVTLEVRMFFDHKTSKTFTGSYVNGKPVYYDRKVGLDYSKYTSIFVPFNQSPYGPSWTASGNIRTITDQS